MRASLRSGDEAQEERPPVRGALGEVSPVVARTAEGDGVVTGVSTALTPVEDVMPVVGPSSSSLREAELA